MTEMMAQIAQNLFHHNAILATIFMSVIPLVELKGSIPFGMSEDIWGKVYMLSAWQAFLWSILGEIVVTVILAFIFKPIYNAIKDKKFFKGIVHFLTDSLNEKNVDLQKSSSLNNENKKLWKKMGLVFAFTAIPVPGTGVYTGTALGILIGLGRSFTIFCVTLGNIIAGAIIMTICFIFPEFSTILFYIFIILILIVLIYKIIVHIIKTKRKNRSSFKNAKIVNEADLWEVFADIDKNTISQSNNEQLKHSLDKSNLQINDNQKLTVVHLRVKGSKIIYYDAITENIDNETANNIKTTLDNLNGKTVCVISPQDSSIVVCDKIMLLTNGNIIAQKTHNDIYSCPLDWGEIFNKDKKTDKSEDNNKKDNA